MKELLTMTIMLMAILSASAHRTGIYIYFDNVEKHVYEDENVRVFICPSDDGKLCVLVNNKTNQVIYVDNGASFFYTNGKAQSMFQNKTTTSGTISSSGTAVNLGGIAAAFGARGRVASALSAITVTNSTGDYNGTSVSEKRIIPVAPMSTEAVYVEDYSICNKLTRMGKAIYKYKVDTPGGNKHLRLIERGKKVKMSKGMKRDYTEQNSILVCKALVKYAFTEDMKNTTDVTVDNYLKALVVDNREGVENYEYARLPYCDAYRQSSEDYTLFETKRDGWYANPLAMVGLSVGGVVLSVGGTLLIIL